MTEKTPTITVRLEETTAFMRRPCFTCRRETDKDAALARVYEDNNLTGYVVCPRCLSDADLGRTVCETAARLRAEAADLDALAEHLPLLPSLADWQAAQVEADVEFVMAAKGVSREAALAKVVAARAMPF